MSIRRDLLGVWLGAAFREKPKDSLIKQHMGQMLVLISIINTVNCFFISSLESFDIIIHITVKLDETAWLKKMGI